MLNLSDRPKLKQKTHITDPQNMTDLSRFPDYLLLPSIRQPMVSTPHEKHSKLTVWPAAG